MLSFDGMLSSVKVGEMSISLFILRVAISNYKYVYINLEAYIEIHD